MKFIIILFILFLSSTSFSQDVNRLIADAKNYENNLDDTKALNKYLDALKIAPASYHGTLYTAISELYSSVAGRMRNNSNEQTEYFQNAFNYAQKALAINPKSSDANFVMGLVLGRTALKKSGKEKIDAVKAIKKYADLAILYNSSNYKAWFLLGKWYYEVSGLNFFERAAVRLIYGDLPAASTGEAIKAFNKSMELNQGFLFNYLSLARAYARSGNKQKAKEEINILLTLPLKTEDDITIKVEANKLLNKL